MAKLNVFGGERFAPLHGAPFVESFGARRRFLKGAVGLAGASRRLWQGSDAPAGRQGA